MELGKRRLLGRSEERVKTFNRFKQSLRSKMAFETILLD
jgi:hypothetical protein